MKDEPDRRSAGPRRRQAGTAERIADDHPPFPSSIHGFHGGHRETICRDAGCRADMEATRTGFIEWTTRIGEPRTPQLFFNFCKVENERRGIWPGPLRDCRCEQIRGLFTTAPFQAWTSLERALDGAAAESQT